jgi:hypothetical protein
MTNWFQRTVDWAHSKIATIGGVAKRIAGWGSNFARRVGSISNTAADIVQGGSAVIGGALGMPNVAQIGNAASDVLRKVSQGGETLGKLLGSFSGQG